MAQILSDYNLEHLTSHLTINIALRKTDDFIVALGKIDDVNFKVLDSERYIYELPFITLYKDGLIDQKRLGQLFAGYRRVVTYHAFEGTLIEHGVSKEITEKILENFYLKLADFSIEETIIKNQSGTVSTELMILQKKEKIAESVILL